MCFLYEYTFRFAVCTEQGIKDKKYDINSHYLFCVCFIFSAQIQWKPGSR